MQSKFDKFADHPNYYKLLVDFRVYDKAGNYAPQSAVQMAFPDDFEKVVGESLTEAQATQNELDADMSSLLDEVRRELKIGQKQFSTRKDIVGVDGKLYPVVVEMDAPGLSRASRSVSNMENHIKKYLVGKKIPVIDENGNVEVLEFAGAEERVKKDGSKGSHKVIDEMARSRNDLQKQAVVNVYEIAKRSSDPIANDEHSHQWLDERGWVRRFCFVMEQGGDIIYPSMLSIGRSKDGRSILYFVRVEKNEGVAIDEIATSDYAKGKNRQAVKITKPSDSWILSQADDSVKQYSRRDSEGNELTPEQQEFFKDSKIRNKKGDLLVVYLLFC